jgi:peptidoglycan-N-acetylmuramic acid deacetylase
MVSEGHLVGNHTMKHPDMTKFTDLESFKKELTDLEDLFYQTTNTKYSPLLQAAERKIQRVEFNFCKRNGLYKTYSGRWLTQIGSMINNLRRRNGA